MFASSIVIALLAASALATPSPTRRAAVPFFTPAAGGGSQLDDAGNGLGEPMNVIISALSSPAVLTQAGFLNFANSIGMYVIRPRVFSSTFSSFPVIF